MRAVPRGIIPRTGGKPFPETRRARTARRPGPSRRARARSGNAPPSERIRAFAPRRSKNSSNKHKHSTVQTLYEFEREQTQTQDNTQISKASKPKPTRARACALVRAMLRLELGWERGFGSVTFIKSHGLLPRREPTAGAPPRRAYPKCVCVSKNTGAGTPARRIPRFGGVRGARGGEFACALRRGPRGARAAFRAL